MRDRRLTERGILRGYARLNQKMNELIREVRAILKVVVAPVKLAHNERQILMTLPTHLIKTYFTLESLGRATAEQIASITHKARAVESAYLNQLCIMGFCRKTREGRKAVFYIGNTDTDKQL